MQRPNQRHGYKGCVVVCVREEVRHGQGLYASAAIVCMPCPVLPFRQPNNAALLTLILFYFIFLMISQRTGNPKKTGLACFTIFYLHTYTRLTGKVILHHERRPIVTAEKIKMPVDYRYIFFST